MSRRTRHFQRAIMQVTQQYAVESSANKSHKYTLQTMPRKEAIREVLEKVVRHDRFAMKDTTISDVFREDATGKKQLVKRGLLTRLGGK